MTSYNLFDGQMELLRKMVAAYEKTRQSGFAIVDNALSTGVLFEGVNGCREQIECDPVDLQALDDEGLVSVFSRDEGRLEARSIEAVRENFVKHTPPVSTVLANNFVQGNVSGGTFQGVFGDSAKQTSSVSFASIVADLKRAGISQYERNELENLMDEWPAAGTDKKPSILVRFNAWCGRNSGNIGELIGRALKAYFGSDT